MNLHALAIVITIALMTMLTRFLPFLVFRRSAPPYILYLGRVLPPAIIGMLVIYCLKDTKISSAPFGVPELISALLVVLLQAWKRNVLVSILAGTVCYMALIHFVF